MKLSLYICNRCGASMQMDELPSGWQRGPRPGGIGLQTHYCRSCTAQLTDRHREMNVELPWTSGRDGQQ